LQGDRFETFSQIGQSDFPQFTPMIQCRLDGLARGGLSAQQVDNRLDDSTITWLELD